MKRAFFLCVNVAPFQRCFLVYLVQCLELFFLGTRTCQCTRSIEVTENIIDIQFEMDGLYIAVVLESTGIYWYSTDSCELATQCILPNRSGPLSTPIYMEILVI